ncbi:MAG TPA: GumC family protein, partial [Cyclobacteriaceae bacterium]
MSGPEMNGSNMDNEFESKPLISFNTRKFIFRLIKYWYMILAFMIIGSFVAFLYIRYTEPVYAIFAQILPEDLSQEEQISRTYYPFQNSRMDKLIDEIEILSSRTLVESVIKKNNYNINFLSVGRVKDFNLYPPEDECPISLSSHELITNAYNTEFIFENFGQNTFDLFWNGKKYSGTFNVPLEGEFGIILITKNFNINYPKIKLVIKDIDGATTDFQSRFRTVLKDNEEPRYAASRAINLSISSSNPLRAIDFLEGVIRAYDSLVVEDKKLISNKTEQFIDEKIAEVEEDLTNSEKENIEFLLENDLLVVGLEGKNAMIRDSIRTIVREQQKLFDYKENLLQIKDLVTLSKKSDTILPSTLYEFIFYSGYSQYPGVSISPLINQYTQLLEVRRELNVSTTPNNPAHFEIVGEIDSLSTYLNKKIEEVVIEIDDTRSEFEIKSDSLYTELSKLPLLAIPSRKINRILGVKEQLYLSLLQQKQELELSQASAVSNTKVLIRPRQARRISLSPTTVYRNGVLAGLGLSIGILAFITLISNKVEDVDDIRSKTKVPVIATIGHSSLKKPIVVNQKAKSGMTEMFRLLRTNLSFFYQSSNGSSDSKLGLNILVTSSISGDGKTFIVSNLGMTLATMGKKVCLVNIDLRKPKLTEYLQIDD